jgi:phospholipid/cholesterol/gamma-HCH transport system substrate-binding protein
MRDSTESRLGIFFVFAIMATLVILESLGTFSFFRRGYHLNSYFKNVHELKVGDSVKMGGVIVGRIESISLTNAQAHVTMNLDKDVQVKTDSKATISFTGLMGQNYISIDFGSASGVKAEDGTTIDVTEQPDLGQIMTKLDNVATGVENLTKSFSGEQIDKLFGPLTELVKNNQSNLTASIGNMRTISDNIARGQGTVGKVINSPELYNSLMSTVSNLQETAPEFKKAATDVRTLIGNVNGMIAQIKSGQGTAGKLIYDDALYKTAAETMTNVDQIMIKINNGNGTVSQLINTNSMMRDVKLSLQKLDKATESLEDTGPLSILGTMVTSLF